MTYRPARDGIQGISALIGARMRELRKGEQLTQEQVAARVGWQKVTVSAVELGRRNVSLPELADVCDRLKMPLSALLDTAGTDVDDDTRRQAQALRGGVPTIAEAWQAPAETDQDREAMLRRRRLALENRMAAVLNIGRDELLQLADELFERDVLTERDQRVESGDGDWHEPTDTATRRSWATREMLHLIRANMLDRLREQVDPPPIVDPFAPPF